MARVRIKDIAEIANVSVGTVDRVLHDRGEVSAATREKVRRLLEEHHYTPDIIASSLALKREFTLGVVMPMTVNDHAFWELPRRGIDQAREELDQYNLVIESYYFDQYSQEDFLKCMKRIPVHRLDGILFAPVFREESVTFLKRCTKEGIPVVLFNSFVEDPSVRCFVGQDAFQSGYVAAKLIDYGLVPGRDILIVNLSTRTDHYSHLNNREKGFRSFFEEHSNRLDHLITIDLNGVGDQVMDERLEETCTSYDVAGIFVTNSRVYRVARFLENRGSMNIRLVGYDLLPESTEYLKRDYIDFLISQNPVEQALRGLNSLFGLVAFNRVPPLQQLLPIDIITRENLPYYKI